MLYVTKEGDNRGGTLLSCKLITSNIALQLIVIMLEKHCMSSRCFEEYKMLPMWPPLAKRELKINRFHSFPAGALEHTH